MVTDQEDIAASCFGFSIKDKDVARRWMAIAICYMATGNTALCLQHPSFIRRNSKSRRIFRAFLQRKMQHWKANPVYFFEEAPFFRLLLPVIIAIICYDNNWLPVLDRGALICTVCFTSLLTIVLFSGGNGRIPSLLRLAALQLSLFSIGWLTCFTNDIRNDERWFGAQLEHADAFVVKVLKEPVERQATWRMKVAVERAYGKTEVTNTSGTASVYLYKNGYDNSIHEGDMLILPNKWTAIKNAGNPFEFNYQKFSGRNKLFYQQFLSNAEVKVIKHTTTGTDIINSVHRWGMNALAQYVKDSATLGLMQAMLLGDEVNFDPELRQMYTDTGIIHVVAISGSHIIVFYWFISLFFFWIRNKRYEYIKYLFAVPLVGLYVVIAGAPISAVRAAVMFSFLAFGMLLQKNRQPLNQLFVTAFFMLLYEPMWLFAVGFQLSFAAVLSLIIFYQPVNKLLTPANPYLRKLWGAVAASIAAEILISPIVIFYYHLLPATFLIANVFAYLFMSAVLMSGLVLVLLSKITIVAKVLAGIIVTLTSFFNGIIGFLQQLNPQTFHHIYLSLLEVLCVYAIIIALAVCILKRQLKALPIALTAMVLLLSLFIEDKWDTIQQQRLVIYNVSKKAYAEVLNGSYFTPVVRDSSIDADKDFATKELHIASGAWRMKDGLKQDVFMIGGKKILFLREPIQTDTSHVFNIDYLVITYPVKEFSARQLQEQFHFRKMVVASNTKRYRALQWKDSCRAANIPAHFTMLDGAFVLNN
jgi:competence protein ComEC